MPADNTDNTFIGGKVHVKILGYVNDDGVADAFNFFDLNQNYGRFAEERSFLQIDWNFSDMTRLFENI